MPLVRILEPIDAYYRGAQPVHFDAEELVDGDTAVWLLQNEFPVETVESDPASKVKPAEPADDSAPVKTPAKRATRRAKP